MSPREPRREAKISSLRRSRRRFRWRSRLPKSSPHLQFRRKRLARRRRAPRLRATARRMVSCAVDAAEGADPDPARRRALKQRPEKPAKQSRPRKADEFRQRARASAANIRLGAVQRVRLTGNPGCGARVNAAGGVRDGRTGARDLPMRGSADGRATGLGQEGEGSRAASATLANDFATGTGQAGRSGGAGRAGTSRNENRSGAFMRSSRSSTAASRT
jgi:hypothetical protein